jgi:nucleoside-diphosphate-sugar epimerase
VLGASGYLGRRLAATLDDRACTLHSWSSPDAGAEPHAWIREDLVHGHAALDVLEPSTVYLLARPATQDAAVLASFTSHVRSLLGTWIARSHLTRIVFASTQLVYATPADQRPVPVGSPLGPETPYDRHKAELEAHLAALAREPGGPRVEVYRLPLLAGVAPASEEHRRRQLLLQWREEYLRGRCFAWPTGRDRDVTWGNSWVHADDVAALMASPRPGAERWVVVQPVSGHASLVDLDAHFRERYHVAPVRADLPVPATAFYLEDNAGCLARPLADAFPVGAT